MKRLPFFLLGCLLSAATLGTGLVSSDRVVSQVREVVSEQLSPEVVFVGDSLTRGGGSWGWIWPSSRNFGHGGFMARQMLPYFRQAVALKPDFIALCAGANDVTDRGYRETETVADIRHMIALAHEAGIPVILTLVPQRKQHIDAIDRLNAKLVDLGADFIIDLNPTVAPDGTLLPQYTTDGTHLSKLAYQLWILEISKARHS